MPYKDPNGTKEWRKRLRVEVLAAYGARCACCGEGTYEFLGVDHVDGDGAEHRKRIGGSGSTRLYRWLKTHEFPPGFQVLCHNCNLAKGFYGHCPHEADDG